jgi:hypothetical protein
VQDVQQAAPDAVLARAPVDAEDAKLGRRHHSVLPAGNAADQQIDMDNCRIDAFAADRGHNCLTCMQF